MTVTQSGERADRALTRLVPGLSRRDAQRLCTEGRVDLRGHPLRKSTILQAGDRVRIDGSFGRVATAAPLPLMLRLVTPHWVIVNKPELMPTAPRHAGESHTLANGLVAAFPEMAQIGYRALEPGLLHRLDNGTSGLLVAARSSFAFERARLALKQSRWHKEYLALVPQHELPEGGTIQGKLESSPRQPQRVRLAERVSLELGAPASDVVLPPFVTQFWVLRREGPIALVRIRVGPAFRHQIRAHFAAIAHGLVNDEVYGVEREPRLAQGRHALHAARVAWEGDPDLPGFSVEEPLASDLSRLVGNPPF